MRAKSSSTAKSSTKAKSKEKQITEDIKPVKNQNRKEEIINSKFKLNCKFKNKKQKTMYETIIDNRITFIRGTAGTGKTLIALFTALSLIKSSQHNIDNIVIIKPLIESSSSIGFLKGSLEEKAQPYLGSYYDNISKLVGNDTARFLKEREYVKDAFLNFLRGSTFGHYDDNGNPIGSFCILDEAQNCTVMEMKTFISRMGEESKLVIMGDSDQIDLKLNRGEKCGLDDAFERFQGLDKIGFIEFTEDDIVRDPFLIEIMKRYKKD
jgi:phosphate starvation-inducible PhoH-like protein